MAGNELIKIDDIKSRIFTIRGMQVILDSESEILKSQNATSSWGVRRTNPYAFAEAGVAMLSAVLRSSIAIRMSVLIIEAFVAMRHFILVHR